MSPAPRRTNGRRAVEPTASFGGAAAPKTVGGRTRSWRVAMTDDGSGKRDLFVSFNGSDRAWATWVAWVLEEAGYSVFFQDWDFRGSFPEHMDRAHREAYRTLAVISDNYLGSEFARSEAWARYAQDAVGREDRLVPVKVGPVSEAGILRQLVYADLTGCDEDEARRRLLERVRKALDADYRAKPAERPGFPGGPPRQVPSRPEFPSAGTEAAAGWPQTGGREGHAMAGNRSVSIGRDAVGNVVVTGDRNRVHARIDARPTKTTLPPAGSVDLGRELAAIRTLLESLGG